MNSHILQFNSVLNATTCSNLISKFDTDNARRPGRTGSGVDPSKKLSTDLSISTLPHWASEQFPDPNRTDNASLHRVLLWLMYLNDVEEGGETQFFYQQASIKPTTGSLVLAPCGFTHTHRGVTPKSNNKYVLASWVKYLPRERLYGVGS